ncbi:uncharacterized protein SOCE26_103500 [Sorangium cellulosum]|uniref:Uncharacterized protein n=1 Tax=Sorangium cellulosum TaxID=56 RepID=A0A2L0FBK6_SORCE|nr:hypothetical protein [Sorangium cellulosum]AUX48809.1 uncharacterized protein SOCE26_103500 [Sorangium cellulosum]
MSEFKAYSPNQPGLHQGTRNHSENYYVEQPRDYYGTQPIKAFPGPASKMQHSHALSRERPDLASDPLAHVRDAIEASKKLLDLPNDWDGEGSQAYDRRTWDRATRFVATQAAYLWNAKAVLPAPDIGPGPNGSIDLAWQEKVFKLLINVPRGADVITYFGRSKSADVKGTIRDSVADHKELFLWLMKAP